MPTAPDGRYDAEVKPISSGGTYTSDPHSDLYKLTENVSKSLKTTLQLLKDDFNVAVSSLSHASPNLLMTLYDL